MTSTRILAVSLGLCLVGFTPRLHAQTSYRFSTITASGHPAPAPSEIGTAGSPAMNAVGQIAYEADGGVFLRTGSKSKTVAAIGTSAPGGGQFLTASSPSLNAKGHLAFVGAALAPSSSGIFLFAEGKYTLLAAEGQSASVGHIFGLHAPSLNANDQVAFLTFDGVFTAANGAIKTIGARCFHRIPRVGYHGNLPRGQWNYLEDRQFQRCLTLRSEFRLLPRTCFDQ
jgi:hypothetical protein